MSEGTQQTDAGQGATCRDCGGRVEPDERFCRTCGTNLSAEGAAGRGPTDPDRTREVVHPRDAVTTVQPAVSAEAGPRPVGTVAEPARSCQRCGASNHARRELCGRCGADLDTGELPPHLDPQPVLGRQPNNGVERTGRRWWLPVVAAIGVMALVAAGLVVAGVGPFERPPVVPDAAFAADRYTGEPEPLLLSDVATTTTRPPAGGDTYAPTLMVDDDRLTAWNSDGSVLADGVGDKIDLFLAEPAWIDQLVIANGDHSDPDTYAANARMKRVQLTLDGGMVYVLNLLDQGLQRQVVDLPEPALTTTVRLEVLESFAGDTHLHLAVSDLELRGWTADEQDADLAVERAEIRRAAGPAVIPEPAADAGD